MELEISSNEKITKYFEIKEEILNNPGVKQ